MEFKIHNHVKKVNLPLDLAVCYRNHIPFHIRHTRPSYVILPVRRMTSRDRL